MAKIRIRSSKTTIPLIITLLLLTITQLEAFPSNLGDVDLFRSRHVSVGDVLPPTCLGQWPLEGKLEIEGNKYPQFYINDPMFMGV